MSEIKNFEDKMKKSVESFAADLTKLRTGRANPAILDHVTVEYYGTPTPLNQVGNITVPEARVIQVAPWEVSLLKDIEKAIHAADIGVSPSSDGKVIRLTFPQPTEDSRKALTKDVKKKGEDAKVAIRNIRRDAIDAFKKQEKAKEITQDEVKGLEDQIQKLTDKYVANIDTVVEDKNKEIMTV